jgi:hypothetical protein
MKNVYDAKFLSVDDREYKDKQTGELKEFHISKVFIEEADEVAEIFTNDPVGYTRGDAVQVEVNTEILKKKVSVKFKS